jgi:hypothetical protein
MGMLLHPGMMDQDRIVQDQIRIAEVRHDPCGSPKIETQTRRTRRNKNEIPPSIQHVKSCKYCTDYKGDPKPILPENLQYAIRMPDGSLMCNTCWHERLKDRIVKISPDSTRAKEIIAEDKLKVDHWNRHVAVFAPNVSKVNPHLKKEYRYR